MIMPADQLDRRIAGIRPLIDAAARPPKGWMRAIRDGLGMTTAQLARRIGVTQPRITEMERAEITGNISLHNLNRAAEAMGCRLVYAFVPVKPLTETIHERAVMVANRKLSAVEHTMRLEGQSVTDPGRHDDARQHIVNELLRRPARLWDEL